MASVDKRNVKVIGGGLAGSEAAWQLAERDYNVSLYEMRPLRMTGAHVSDQLGELVCSNSLGSRLLDRASGLLQAELKMAGSLLIKCAEEEAVPAGGALAVDREMFAKRVTERIHNHPNIEIIREEVLEIPDGPTIIATGPLTAKGLSQSIARFTGQEYLYFYDAIAPIVTAESINMNRAFVGSRYNRGIQDEGDYINCPMDHDQYMNFVQALREAATADLRDFEREAPHFFEGCLPIETLAGRGDDSLAFGPMRPIGLRDPRTGKRPYAVVQLRRDNLIGSLYNLVGFQTNVRWADQERVLRMIPGLEEAEFIRLGQMHRNTFINSPTLLYPTMQSRKRSDLYFAGQITGIEGYVGNIATGLLAAINIALYLAGKPQWVLPISSMLGALCNYITRTDPKHFQPMKANFGIMPELSQHVKSKKDRYVAYAHRALEDLRTSVENGDDYYLRMVASTQYNQPALTIL